MEIRFDAELWEDQPTQVTWVFVTLPIEAADELRFMTQSLPKVGFGTIKVRVTLGSDQWLTSVFPDKSSGSFLLPIKAPIRKNQGLVVGDRCTLVLQPIGV